MRAGSLKDRISFEAREVGKDARGQPLQSWLLVKSVRANVQALSARELMLAQANRSVVTDTIEIRYMAQFADPAVLAPMRIVFGSRVFNIHGVIDPDGRKTALNISCSEGLNSG